MSDSTTKVTFRRSLNRWWLVACAAGFAVIGLVMIPESSHEGGYYAPDSTFAIGSRVFYGLIVVVSLFLVVRVARMGIFADDDGLTIRNVFNSHRVAWEEIARFERPAAHGAFRNTGLRVVMRKGPPVYAALYSAGPFNKRDFADHTVARLEALRSKYSLE
jgi:hypothetical protein